MSSYKRYLKRASFVAALAAAGLYSRSHYAYKPSFSSIPFVQSASGFSSRKTVAQARHQRLKNVLQGRGSYVVRNFRRVGRRRGRWRW